MRRFPGIKLGDNRTTILHLRRLPERHGLTQAVFHRGERLSLGQEHMLRLGTPVGATVADAPSSIEDKAKTRAKEMSFTIRGNGWYFRMKAIRPMRVWTRPAARCSVRRPHRRDP